METSRTCAIWLCAALLAGCASEDFEPNQPPTLHAQADTAVAVGDTLHLTAEAMDFDDDDLRFHLAVRIDRMELFPVPTIDAGLDRVSGEFWFRPRATDRPGRRFVFLVDDSRGGTDSTEFVVAVR